MKVAERLAEDEVERAKILAGTSFEKLSESKALADVMWV